MKQIGKKELKTLIRDMRKFWDTGDTKYLKSKTRIWKSKSTLEEQGVIEFASDVCKFLFFANHTIDEEEVYKILEAASISIVED